MEVFNIDKKGATIKMVNYSISQSNLGAVRKLIFDLDDTLLFISDEWYDVFRDFVDRFDLPISVEDFYCAIAEMEKQNPDKYITKELFTAIIREKVTPKFDDVAYDGFLEGYAKIPLVDIDTVQNVLTYLSSKYELIAYSNWFTDNQTLRLKLNGMDKYFSKIWGWDLLPAKPSRKGLAEIVGNDDVKDYVFIGDNLDCDIRLPDSIGMGTIFLNRRNISQNQFREIGSVSELRDIL